MKTARLLPIYQVLPAIHRLRDKGVLRFGSLHVVSGATRTLNSPLLESHAQAWVYMLACRAHKGKPKMASVESADLQCWPRVRTAQQRCTVECEDVPDSSDVSTPGHCGEDMYLMEHWTLTWSPRCCAFCDGRTKTGLG